MQTLKDQECVGGQDHGRTAMPAPGPQGYAPGEDGGWRGACSLRVGTVRGRGVGVSSSAL